MNQRVFLLLPPLVFGYHQHWDTHWKLLMPTLNIAGTTTTYVTTLWEFSIFVCFFSVLWQLTLCRLIWPWLKFYRRFGRVKTSREYSFWVFLAHSVMVRRVQIVSSNKYQHCWWLKWFHEANFVIKNIFCTLQLLRNDIPLLHCIVFFEWK